MHIYIYIRTCLSIGHWFKVFALSLSWNCMLECVHRPVCGSAVAIATAAKRHVVALSLLLLLLASVKHYQPHQPHSSAS